MTEQDSAVRHAARFPDQWIGCTCGNNHRLSRFLDTADIVADYDALIASARRAEALEKAIERIISAIQLNASLDEMPVLPVDVEAAIATARDKARATIAGEGAPR